MKDFLKAYVESVENDETVNAEEESQASLASDMRTASSSANQEYSVLMQKIPKCLAQIEMRYSIAVWNTVFEFAFQSSA